MQVARLWIFVLAAMVVGCGDMEEARLRAENSELKEQIASLKQELDETRFGAERLLATAENALAEKRHDEALAVLEDLIKRHPGSANMGQAKTLLVRAETDRAEHAAAVAKKAEEEARKKELERKRATAAMKVERDDVREIDWYRDRSTRTLANQVHLYFGAQSDRVLPLRLVFQYYGDDWLFVKRITVKADDRVFTLPFDAKRDNSGGKVWEWSDQVVDDQSAKAVEAMLTAKMTTIRFEGDKYYHDLKLSSAQRTALANVAKAHAALGGSDHPRLLDLAGR